MRSVQTISLALLAIAVSTACTRDQSSPAAMNEALGPGQVATVNGERIPESVFRLYALNAARKSVDEMTPDEREAVIEDLARLKLLEQEARERGLLTERAIAAELELQRLNSVARAMARRFLEQNAATEQELRQLYEENLERLAPTEYKARHILVETADEANALIAQLDQGTPFAELAQAHANGPTGPNGGDLGWFSAASMTPPIVQAVQAMTIGSHSAEPVQSEFGYHVLVLDDTRRSEPPSLDAVRNDLKSVVERQKLDAFVRSLRDEADVELTATP